MACPETRKQLQSLSIPLLFRHLIFDKPSSLRSFIDRMGPPARLGDLSAQGPILSPWAHVYRHTLSLSFAFDLEQGNLSPASARRQIPPCELAQSLIPCPTILRHTSRLEEFSNVTGHLATLPLGVLEALAESSRKTLKKLDGFALHLGCLSSIDGFRLLASFERLGTLCTGPIWLPDERSQRTEPLRVLPLLLNRIDIKFPPFHFIRDVFVPFSPNNMLFDALVESELPNLQRLTARVWSPPKLWTFLEKHGSKIIELDLQSLWPHLDETHGYIDNTVLAIMEACRNLQQLILHEDSSLEVFGRIVSSDQIAPLLSLHTIRMGTSSRDGPFILPKYQERPQSWPVAYASTPLHTASIIRAHDWHNKLPNLRTVLAYPNLPRRWHLYDPDDDAVPPKAEVMEDLKMAWQEKGISVVFDEGHEVDLR